MFNNHSNLYQKSSENRPTFVQKSIKIYSKIDQNRSQGPLGELWRPSWPQEQKKCVRPPFVPPLLGAKLEPKIDQNRSQERSKRRSFFWLIWRSIFGAIWCQLGPILAPQSPPKWGQVGSQIDASWGVDLKAVFERILVQFLLTFLRQHTWPK